MDRTHGMLVGRDRQTRSDLKERLAMVVGAEVAFALLVDYVTGAPPAFVTTVVFGIALAIGLGWQARRSPV